MTSTVELEKAGLKKAQISFLLDLANHIPAGTAYARNYPRCKEKNAGANGCRLKSKLLQNPVVTAWLEKNFIEREENNRKLMSIDDRKEYLVQIIQHGKVGDALKALDIYNKMEAVYEHRSRVEGDVAVTIGWGGDDDS